MNTAAEREAERQRWLLRVLWHDASAQVVPGWLHSARDEAVAHGLAAYRGNAGATAERALASAFPTIAALVGEDSFARLARDLWQHRPPARGDLGEWGEVLPEFIAAQTTLSSEPYLADTARLDWLVHRASRAADGPGNALALEALGQHPPETLALMLRPGCALLASRWPVATIWQAHQAQGDDRFAAARAALAAAQGERAFVWRDGFAVRVDALATDTAAFTQAVLDGASLAAALDAAGEHFAFDRWLVQALQLHWLVAVERVRTSPAPS